MIKLIGFDLDGTLFTDDKRITEVTRNTVAEAAERGVFIVPVTGRPFTAVPDIVRELPGVRYLITASGAVIYDLEAGKLLRHDVIAGERMVPIIRDLRRHEMICMVFIDGVGYVNRSEMEQAVANASSEAGRIYLRNNRIQVDDIIDLVSGPISGVEKFTVNLPFDGNGGLIGLDEALEVLEPYREELHEVYGGDITLEVGNKTSDKGSALKWLGDYLGVDESEIMAFGDSGNDLDMVGAVGTFVAVSNATETIKAAADYVTLSNEEDGVAAAIRRFILESDQ